MSDYGKHNLYWGIYGERRFVALSDAPYRRWRVERVHESPEGVVVGEGGDRIALILEDKDFWPVISFLTPEEAAGMAEQLTEIVGYAQTTSAKATT